MPKRERDFKILENPLKRRCQVKKKDVEKFFSDTNFTGLQEVLPTEMPLWLCENLLLHINNIIKSDEEKNNGLENTKKIPVELINKTFTDLDNGLSYPKDVDEWLKHITNPSTNVCTLLNNLGCIVDIEPKLREKEKESIFSQYHLLSAGLISQLILKLNRENLKNKNINSILYNLMRLAQAKQLDKELDPRLIPSLLDQLIINNNNINSSEKDCQSIGYAVQSVSRLGQYQCIKEPLDADKINTLIDFFIINKQTNVVYLGIMLQSLAWIVNRNHYRGSISANKLNTLFKQCSEQQNLHPKSVSVILWGMGQIVEREKFPETPHNQTIETFLKYLCKEQILSAKLISHSLDGLRCLMDKSKPLDSSHIPYVKSLIEMLVTLPLNFFDAYDTLHVLNKLGHPPNNFINDRGFELLMDLVLSRSEEVHPNYAGHFFHLLSFFKNSPKFNDYAGSLFKTMKRVSFQDLDPPLQNQLKEDAKTRQFSASWDTKLQKYLKAMKVITEKEILEVLKENLEDKEISLNLRRLAPAHLLSQDKNRQVGHIVSDFINQHQSELNPGIEYRLILPIAVDDHWIGVIFKFNYGKISSGIYFNSLKKDKESAHQHRTIIKKELNDFNLLADNFQFFRNNSELEQTDEYPSGIFLVNNLINEVLALKSDKPTFFPTKRSFSVNKKNEVSHLHGFFGSYNIPSSTDPLSPRAGSSMK